MFVLGITGGIACGKSTVSQYLSTKGIPIIDGDKVSHELSLPHGAIYNAYVEHFGKEILHSDGTLNRKAIASRVFTNEDELQWMNKTLHPIIKNEILRRIKAYSLREKIIILDIPLLYEAGWDKYCNEVWVVYVDQEEQIKRIILRDNATRQEALNRINAQMPVEKKLQLAQGCISTAGSMEDTQKAIEKSWHNLMKKVDK